MVFKKILVALDRSPQAPVVFEKALELVQKEASNLMILHCLSLEVQAEIAPFMGTVVGLDPTRGRILQRIHHESSQHDIEQAKEWLESYYQQATAQGIPAEFDCSVGDAGSLICDLARNWGADVIVIGRRGRGGIAEMLLGSVSNYVVHHAPCSVLVIQGLKPTTVDTKAAAT